MQSLWNSFVYEPLYNLLIGIIAFVPGHSVGLGIILLTFLVKLALFPSTKKASLAQRKLRALDPELKKLREKFKDKQQLAVKTMELYKEKNISPFSGCLPMIVQIPIIIGLYILFLKGLTISPEVMYGFIPHPSSLDMNFLSIDLSGKSALLALLSGVTQYIQTKLMFPKIKEEEKPKTTEKVQKDLNFQEEFTKSLNMQMLYVFPILIIFVSYTTSAAVALYFVASNIFGIGQEYLVKRSHEKLL